MKKNEIPPCLSCFSAFILSALVLSVVLYIRIRLLPIPLERDEGEFAYMGQLLLKGIPPYLNAYTMKLPGVSGMYAIIMFLFGETSAAIHFGLLIVNAFCVLLIYLLTKRLFDRNAALVSCTAYAVLSLSLSVYGIFAHATHFVVLFFLAGYLLLLRHIERDRPSDLLISGICFGIAITMKQHAFVLFVFAFSYLIWQGWGHQRSATFVKAGGLFLLGCAIPYGVIVAGTGMAGVWNQFWFWTVQYPREYVSDQTLLQGVGNFTRSFLSIIQVQLLFWIVAATGIATVCTKKTDRTDRVFILGFLISSFLSICPGLYFREHYFIMVLPAVAVLTGAAARSAVLSASTPGLQRFEPLIPGVLLLAATSTALYNERECFFTLTPTQVSRAAYDENPFPEAADIARYLRDHTSPNERIAVLGSEPEIYFYADRLSATGHIYMYGLMEDHPHAEQMQVQMIREIEAARPNFIVVVDVAKSWLKGPHSRHSVEEWREKYVRELYDRVGVVDIIDSTKTRFLWEKDAMGYVPVSRAFVTVFKRKQAGMPTGDGRSPSTPAIRVLG